MSIHLIDFAIYFLSAKPAGCRRPSLGRINFNTYKVESCGNVTFYYPFRIKDQDDSNDWFNVICNKTANGQKLPFLNINGTNLQILDFDFFHGTVMVNHPITYFNCRKNHHNGRSLNLIGTRLYYSDSDNIFWSSGCGNLITVFYNEMDNFTSGCLQPSCRINNETSSIVGCRVNIPQGLSSFYVNMSSMVDSSDYKRKRSCGFASVISSDYDLTFELEDFHISNTTHIPTRLQWGTPISGVCQLNDGLDISCTSDGEYCWSRLSSIHLCACNMNITIRTLCKELPHALFEYPQQLQQLLLFDVLSS
ncbi:hypothetical protein J1N35_019385 [Gossypium stocksii]|uniref:Wall-associated receptor kinase galacturonan-binding domain-containing protein n=1 Tax=Gossypium stocksii TaxID=47602 RepID=A0A9D3VSE5_9ROSI|nr:hypothetical protein J1N35_019385 [Gossypium stocksii]